MRRGVGHRNYFKCAAQHSRRKSPDKAQSARRPFFPSAPKTFFRKKSPRYDSPIQRVNSGLRLEAHQAVVVPLQNMSLAPYKFSIEKGSVPVAAAQYGLSIPWSA